MTKDLQEINAHLQKILLKHSAILKTKSTHEGHIEVSGTIEAMQGKKKVDGIYFASVVPKPKDVRFYFFPLYTHKDGLDPLVTPDLRKALKGKTCFHVKSLTNDMISDLQRITDEAVILFQKDNLLATS